MLRQLTLFSLAVLFFPGARAQQLPMPRDVDFAFRTGTRSEDGLPGKNYWQNHGRYNITIKATPPDRTIRGSEDISYTNNSPDTLKELVFRLIVNIHRPGAARAREASADYLTTGMHIDTVLVGGRFEEMENNSSTVAYLPVDKPLAPHDSVKVFVKWHYNASLQSGREGMIDSTTYFLAYSYPRIAVYDDYQGWDVTSFNDALEFYNDFNDYTLQVQVPANYIVWATGTLQNANAVLQPEYAGRLRRSMTGDEVLHIASAKEMKTKSVTTKNALNTWRFTADNVPDVAFGLSDHFAWDASSVIVDEATKRRASVQAAYNDTSADFHHMVAFCRHSLAWLSANWPGIPYPYEKTTVFQGYAGMEYPMMANDETYADTAFSKFVAAHEIAHTYMPFYMGINETRYGFMDEGWATTLEYLLNINDMGREQAENFFKRFRINNWTNNYSPGEELPIITPGPNLIGGGLGDNEYGKPSLGYLAVKDLLGDVQFKNCLHEYMRRWNGKHPLPWDFFNTFNAASGTNLNWFWNNWFFSSYYIDLAIEKVDKSGKGFSVSIQNPGGMAAPFDMKVTYEDGTNETFHENIAVWKEDQAHATVTVNTGKNAKTIQLDGGIFMDAHPGNNIWKTN